MRRRYHQPRQRANDADGRERVIENVEKSEAGLWAEGGGGGEVSHRW